MAWKRGLCLAGFFLALFIRCSKGYVSFGYEEGSQKYRATPGYLKGEVVEAKNYRPIPGALLIIFSKEGSFRSVSKSDESGSFSIAVPPGTHRLKVTASGYKPGNFRIEAPKEGKTARFLLERIKPIGEIGIAERKTPPRFRGEVIGAKSRLPVPGALITFLDADIKPLYTNSSGRFSLTVPFRTYKIRITASGYVSSEVEIDVSGEGGWIKFFLKKG